MMTCVLTCLGKPLTSLSPCRTSKCTAGRSRQTLGRRRKQGALRASLTSTCWLVQEGVACGPCA